MILRAVFSLASLAILTLIFNSARIVFALQHLHLPPELETVWSLYTRLFIGCWVYLDRRRSRVGLPFEFEAFVFFAWPLFLPYYLYKSRGPLRGILLTALLFFVLVLIPGGVAGVLRVL